MGTGSIQNKQLIPNDTPSSDGTGGIQNKQLVPGGGPSAVGSGTGNVQNSQLVPGGSPSAVGSGTGNTQNKVIKPGGLSMDGVTPSADSISADDAKTANIKSYAGKINSQWAAYMHQQQNNIDNQTQQNVNKAQRAYEDSLGSYQKQYRDATTNMYQGMDNAALTADTSGRFGGMATARVNSIQNQYQQQRQQLALQQQKLATDTAREIEDLRAQGEFDKADALLKARQQQFQQLYEDAVRVDENQYSNWQYDNTLEREDQSIQREQQTADKEYLQKLGQGFLNLGVMPSESMLTAMGMSQATAQLYINAILNGR